MILQSGGVFLCLLVSSLRGILGSSFKGLLVLCFASISISKSSTLLLSTLLSTFYKFSCFLQCAVMDAVCVLDAVAHVHRDLLPGEETEVALL